MSASHQSHTRGLSPLVLVAVKVIKSLARGRVVTPAAGVADSVLGTPVYSISCDEEAVTTRSRARPIRIARRS